MSDIYDYVYAHITTTAMRPVFQNGPTYYNTSPKAMDFNGVNSRDFTQKDLSLETISRSEKTKKCRISRKRQVTCLDASTCDSLHEDEYEVITSSSNETLYDATYYTSSSSSVSSNGKNTAFYHNSSSDCNDSSDSEDSGIFVNEYSSPIHLYENLHALALPKQEDEIKGNSTTHDAPVQSNKPAQNGELKESKKSKKKFLGSKSLHKFFCQAKKFLSL